MKKLLFPKVFALTAFLVLYSCSAEEEDNTPPPSVVKPTTPEPEPEPEVSQYTLTVTAGEGGSVSTEGGTYDEGTEVTITATPAEGYEFIGWEGSDSTEASLTVTLGANTTLNALFEAVVQYTVNINSDEGGSVSIESGLFTKGAELTIVATADEGYEFLGWYGYGQDDIFGYDSTLSLIINGNEEINARFYLKMPSFERYSPINETTSSFQRQKYFYRYLSKEEYANLGWYNLAGETTFCNWSLDGTEEGTCYGFWPGYRVHGSYDTWGDFNNDNKLDYFASSWTFTPDSKFGNEKSQFIFISDFFTNTNKSTSVLQSNYINWASPTSIADFDNNGYLDILFLHNNRHNNSVNWNPNQISANSGENIPPGQPVIVYFEPEGQFSEVPFGPDNLDTHTSSAGDIDNDGDVDILMMPWAVQGAGLSTSPKIILNSGGRSFETVELLSDYESFIEKYPFNWNVLSFNLFDLDGDGNLDIVGGTKLDDKNDNTLSYFEYWEDVNKGFHNNNKPWILWGDNNIQFKSDNLKVLEKNEHRYNTNMLGSGFTDFDSDGDIDVIILSTVVEDDIFYRNYELTLFENKGDRVFEDVTSEKIDYYYNMNASKYGEFYFIAMIDKDEDGDFDIVPYGAGNSFGESFINNLYWENTGGQFVRRELD